MLQFGHVDPLLKADLEGFDSLWKGENSQLLCPRVELKRIERYIFCISELIKLAQHLYSA